MWIETPEGLSKSFEFANFTKAFAFMVQVAFIAEKMDHHPNWTNVYNRVDIILCTHSAGNSITEKDHILAHAIDKLITK